MHIQANVEVRYCEVGRGGSLIISIPKGKVHFVDTSALRKHPNGIRPLLGLVRIAELPKQPINDIYFLNAVNIRCVKVHG